MTRSTEAYLDLLAEAAEDTDCEAGMEAFTLRVEDERIDEVAAFCRLAAPKTIEHGRVTWRETSGRFRGIAVTLRTKERRVARRVAA